MRKKERDVMKEFIGGVKSGKTPIINILIHNLQEENKVLKKAFKDLAKAYCKLYCRHYCHSKPCKYCENGDTNFIEDMFIQNAQENNQ